MKSAFLLSKGLLCLYDKQNNTVACRYGISLLVFNSKRNFISTRAHVGGSARKTNNCVERSLKLLDNGGDRFAKSGRGQSKQRKHK